MKRRNRSGGSGVWYKQSRDYSLDNNHDSSININTFDDGSRDIVITVNNKTQTLKGLSETDITTLCRQILHISCSDDWRCKCDQNFQMKKYSEDYFKIHGVYPILRG